MGRARGVAVVCALAFCAPAFPADGGASVVRAPTGPNTLLRLRGLPEGSFAGTTIPTPVAAAGDVNGDGLTDVLSGSAGASPRGRPEAGSAFVVFGRPERRSVDVRSLGSAGFRIDGAPPFLPVELEDDHIAGARAGTSVAGVGDVNGDGLGDIAVGAPQLSGSGRPLAGGAWVVFGRRSNAPVDLASLGDRGFRIDGPTPSGFAGRHVSAAGDVNADGLDDVALAGRTGVWVAFGKADAATVDLRTSRSALTVKTPNRLNDEGQLPSEFPVGPAGDVNGDGRSDLVIGAPDLTPRNRFRSGAAFVVYGRPAGRVDLTRLGTGGFRIDGDGEEGFAGRAVNGGGDFNGDGLADVLVGAPDWGSDGSDETLDYGAAYVVFGSRSPRRVELGRLGRRGLALFGDPQEEDGEIGTALTYVGDVNHDGRDDIAVGAPGQNAQCTENTGAVQVMFGRRRGGNARLDRPGLTGGFRLDGDRRLAQIGSSLATIPFAAGPAASGLLVGSEPPQERGRTQPPRVVALTHLRGRAREASTPCLGIRVQDRRITTVLRRGKMRLRISSRRGGSQAVVYVVSLRKGREEAVLAAGTRHLRRGTRTYAIRLSKRGRRILSGRRRVRVAAVILEFTKHERRTTYSVARLSR